MTVVPQHILNQLNLYGADTTGLIGVTVKRSRDEIRPEMLHYPWKDHPVDR